MNLAELKVAIIVPEPPIKVARTVYLTVLADDFLNKHFSGKGEATAVIELLIKKVIEDEQRT